MVPPIVTHGYLTPETPRKITNCWPRALSGLMPHGDPPSTRTDPVGLRRGAGPAAPALPTNIPAAPPLDPLPARPYTPAVTADAADRDHRRASPQPSGLCPSARVAQTAAPRSRDGTLPRHAEDPE